MLSNAADRTIVASTVALARNLGLGVAAEGIEDAATLEALRAMDCDEGQGFHIARPMDGDEALRWARAR
ncbi:MAG TPA: EAL domain-containing protein, partial [Usitatibacter sp.]|nr:EAL domain-containing protein [Usitatibacter sp.]